MRGKKTVSLGGKTRDRVRVGHEDATPERLALARAGGSASIDAQGVRRLGDPFDVLQARNLLDRQNPEANAVLWQAGDRLRRHWHGGRLDGLTAFDFTRDSVDTSPTGATSPSEAAVRHRDAYRAAADAVGQRLIPYVTGIVIDARPAAELRQFVSDTGHARTAEALVIERLREALHRLCDHWGMKPDARPRRTGVWRDASDPLG